MRSSREPELVFEDLWTPIYCRVTKDRTEGIQSNFRITSDYDHDDILLLNSTSFIRQKGVTDHTQSWYTKIHLGKDISSP